MSAPKRLHEEGGHSAPLKRPCEEAGIFSTSGKQNQLVNHEFHLPFEYGQEGRLAKVQRIESRESDKRTYQLHRFPSASASSLDHQITSDNRLEVKTSMDDLDVKNESKEVKAENRDLYTEIKKDSQVSKVETDIKLDTRGDDKELRLDRGPHGDHRVDTKFEKDNYPGAAFHLAWRDPKEHPRGKKFFETLTDGSDSWHVARGSIQSNDEVPKDASTAVERDPTETQEAVGENKVDLKADDKFRDKDRRRSRDFGEKDKNDRRSNMQHGVPIIDRKELLREERDVEKWERDRNDAVKEKYDIEKYSAKRELSNDKGILIHEKEFTDGSLRVSDQENITTESKKLKEDSWKAYDVDVKEKKRERDIDSGDRHEQHGIDDGYPEGDGATEKEKEASGGVQHRRRMVRTRLTVQAFPREPRFRSRARDNEGSQGKPETPAILYKAGECMQELLKSWKEFKASQDNKNDESVQSGPTLDIRIPAEYVTSTNRQVKGAQLWGTDIYTNDSDLVAVLMHAGYCCPTSSPPPPAIQEFKATVRVLPPKDIYTSSLRNNVRSRAWGAGIGCSFRVERCCIVKKGGGTIDLEPRLTHTSAVEPTLAPVSVERTMTTRAAASNALRQQRFVREVTIQYNLCNEPWLKYALNIVADKGLKKPLYTSARLKKGEVLYLETHFNRYELCFNGEKALHNGSFAVSSHTTDSEHEKLQNHSSHGQNGESSSSDRDNIIDIFRWSRCKKAFPEKIMRSLGVPLPVEHLEVLAESLDWEDIQWSQTGVWVAGKEYSLARAHFLSPN